MIVHTCVSWADMIFRIECDFRNKRFEIDLLVKSSIHFFFLFLICAIAIVHTCASWADMIFRIECDFEREREREREI